MLCLPQTYLRDFLMEIAFSNVGWDSFRGDVDAKVARDYMTRLACYARVPDCRAKAFQAYQSYKKDP